MRYRALSPTGDMQFGQSSANFLVNSSAAVAQAVRTRLLLMLGEWFLNTADGTPYATQILGTGTTLLYDAAIKARILGTRGVTSLSNYSSSLNSVTRKLTVNATVGTIYSNSTIPISVAP